MATNRSYDPPIDGPPARTPAVISQPPNREVNQPWGAIPSVMAKIGSPAFARVPIEGRSASGRGKGRRP